MRPLLVATLATASLVTPATAAAPVKITGSGAGKVKLGASFASLRNAGRVGPARPGCPVQSPRPRVARLRSPLKGFVELGARRNVREIFVTGGAAARGVKQGDRLLAIRRAYRGERIDRTTEEMFGILLVTIPRSAGGRIEFAVDAKTRRVTGIGIPQISFCE